MAAPDKKIFDAHSGQEFIRSLGLDEVTFQVGEPEDPEDNSIEQEKLKSRNTSIKEGSAYSVMDGLGHKYVTPYALAVGANNTQIGILSSLPPLVGSFSQLGTIRLMEHVSRKKITFIAAFLQAVMWLVMLGVGALFFVKGVQGPLTPLLVILSYTFLFVFGSMIAPAWTSWMRDLVPNKCGSFFGYRNRVIGFVLLVSMLIGGFILDYFKHTKVFLGFIIIFSLAFLFRTISSFLFLRQHEPRLILSHQRVSFREVLRLLLRENFGRFIFFQTAMSFVVGIASPFFTVYLLKDLGFSYTDFIIVTLASAGMSMLFMPVWGKFADRFGNLRTLKITGFLIALVPLLWLFIPLFIRGNPDLVIPFLIFAEGFSGLVWAGFNLASANFIFDAVSRENTPAYTAYFNIFNNMGLFVGALLGGLLSYSSFHLWGFSGILFVFVLSGIGRFLIAFLLIHSVKEARKVRKFDLDVAKDIIHHLTPQQIIRIIR
jgi:MFS family permease